MKKPLLQKLITYCMTLILLTAMLGSFFPMSAQAANIVVCIDPGHGGTNNGAHYFGLWEKDLDLIIANAMREELMKYEGITVVMTRTGDTTLSLEERAQIAADAGADFLYCIHLNASEDHNLFGSEVWVSAFGEYYSRGKSFGTIELQQLSEDIGVYTARGVKTRLSTNDGGDYYGIIKHSVNRGVTPALIEHCFMDEAHDYNFYQSMEALKLLGKADATAVAKYYGLSSSILNVDYSSYACPAFPVPTDVVMPDTTEPEVSRIELIGHNMINNTASLHVYAADSDSKIIYYSYSCDGGKTWSKLWGWNADGEGYITITLPKNQVRDVCIRVWNQYDKYTESNHIIF